MATVTGLVLLFAFTSGGVIWLARDVNRVVANRSTAQSIAFQAARAGAQQLAPADLRGVAAPVVDPEAAALAASAAASELFAGYGVSGSVVRVTVELSTVEVEVVVSDPAGDVTGVGAARAEGVP
jgi:hypothetical protein